MWLLWRTELCCAHRGVLHLPGPGEAGVSPMVICGLLTSRWLCCGPGAFTHRIVFPDCCGHSSQHKVSEGSLSSFLPFTLPCQGLGHAAPGPGWRGSFGLITTRLLCLTSIQALHMEVVTNWGASVQPSLFDDPFVKQGRASICLEAVLHIL